MGRGAEDKARRGVRVGDGAAVDVHVGDTTWVSVNVGTGVREGTGLCMGIPAREGVADGASPAEPLGNGESRGEVRYTAPALGGFTIGCAPASCPRRQAARTTPSANSRTTGMRLMRRG